MTSAATLIATAKAALAAADAAEQHETDARLAASEARWAAAEAMAALSDGGMGHRDIGAAVGLTQRTVSYYIAASKKGEHARAQLFTDALREVRGGWGHAPTSIEGKAKAVAEYIADPEVWAKPEVIAAATKAQIHAAREALGPPTIAPTKEPPGLMAARAWERMTYWEKLWGQVEGCRKSLEQSMLELDRSGLPDGAAGKLVKAFRALARTAAKAEEVFTDTGIGRS